MVFTKLWHTVLKTPAAISGNRIWVCVDRLWQEWVVSLGNDCRRLVLHHRQAGVTYTKITNCKSHLGVTGHLSQTFLFLPFYEATHAVYAMFWILFFYLTTFTNSIPQWQMLHTWQTLWAIERFVYLCSEALWHLFLHFCVENRKKINT